MSVLDKIDYDLLAKQTSFLLNYPWREGGIPEEIEGLLNLIDHIFDDFSDLLKNTYDKGGQSAVYDYVLQHHPTWRWGWCEGCEHDSPAIPDDDICAVCWGYTISASV